MGIEYKINSNHEIYLTVKLEEDGFYFCDYLVNPELASHIFRKLIDEALFNSSKVLIYEP